MVPLLHGPMLNEKGRVALVFPGGVTDTVLEVAQEVSPPVGTSEY
jgi:hypothetical protein